MFKVYGKHELQLTNADVHEPSRLAAACPAAVKLGEPRHRICNSHWTDTTRSTPGIFS
jgi:hypothetical protein